MELSGMTRRGFLRSATVASAATLTAGHPLGASGLAHAHTNMPETQVEPVAALFYFTVKEGRLREAEELLPRIAATSRDDPGCLYYVFYQELANPRQFVLVEQWQDRAALATHIEHLQEVFGPPRPGEGLPAVFMELVDDRRGVRHRVFA
jgi:quinol monooxygenase YgiN